MSQPAPGDNAPEISLPRDGGETVTLAQYAGQKVVVYFYPRDDTPGCTKEAVGFTERASDFAAANTVVLGISKDTVAKHDKFRDKHNLSVVLLSDADGDVCERYGVWGEKQMYGKTFMGIERATFLIDTEGRIAQVWPKVKVPGHVDAVLEAAQAL
ncbi:peroxiredoxin Q/BCP [Loktanella sp. DSM 29012]|uniref:thioredoxin-dependent peroxiredoxin n=1 Tax=Loktanella gaetbuli TaxID=2881335 RepID=A0ABS8BRE1_9RHOB|nr:MULTISPECIES: thioredoxin-dependent thiol peroxidase [Loktanella]MCB5198295.1 thioredoxin-dependent thiol peroxidase [Loktanella gaetbuli]SEQ69178.1 peroxiredoxin Q/BCP [Loktanella sp. DSM 29012]